MLYYLNNPLTSRNKVMVACTVTVAGIVTDKWIKCPLPGSNARPFGKQNHRAMERRPARAIPLHNDWAIINFIITSLIGLETERNQMNLMNLCSGTRVLHTVVKSPIKGVMYSATVNTVIGKINLVSSSWPELSTVQTTKPSRSGTATCDRRSATQ